MVHDLHQKPRRADVGDRYVHRFCGAFVYGCQYHLAGQHDFLEFFATTRMHMSQGRHEMYPLGYFAAIN